MEKNERVKPAETPEEIEAACKDVNWRAVPTGTYFKARLSESRKITFGQIRHAFYRQREAAYFCQNDHVGTEPRDDDKLGYRHSWIAYHQGEPDDIEVIALSPTPFPEKADWTKAANGAWVRVAEFGGFRDVIGQIHRVDGSPHLYVCQGVADGCTPPDKDKLGWPYAYAVNPAYADDYDMEPIEGPPEGFKKPVSVKLGRNYTAVVHPGHITIGCQKFDNETVRGLAAALID